MVVVHCFSSVVAVLRFSPLLFEESTRSPNKTAVLRSRPSTLSSPRLGQSGEVEAVLPRAKQERRARPRRSAAERRRRDVLDAEQRNGGGAVLAAAMRGPTEQRGGGSWRGTSSSLPTTRPQPVPCSPPPASLTPPSYGGSMSSCTSVAAGSVPEFDEAASWREIDDGVPGLCLVLRRYKPSPSLSPDWAWTH